MAKREDGGVSAESVNLLRDAVATERRIGAERANALLEINTRPEKRGVKRTMTIVRHGNFRVRPMGDKHCGVNLGNAVINGNYWVRIRCTPRLDDRGFLFEQRVVDEVFQTLDATAMSCELLAYVCCRKVIERVTEDNRNLAIRSVEVSISAEPFGATLTYKERFE